MTKKENIVVRMYKGLGKNPTIRFRRFILILLIVSGVVIYGFHCKAINISLGFGVESEK